MARFRMCLPYGAVLLLLGLAWAGYPHPAQAMSLFMDEEEPQESAPPPQPVVAKPPPPSGQPAAKAADPATGAPALPAPGTAVAVPPPQGSSAPPVPKPVTAPAVAPPPPSVEEPAGYTYDPKSRREPFQSLVSLLKSEQTRSELPSLQRVPLSDLKLLGIVWGGYGYYGVVRTPDGKGYTVKEGMLMGTNKGVISKITEKAVIVSEPSIDITGKTRTKEIEILLRPKEVS